MGAGSVLVALALGLIAVRQAKKAHEQAQESARWARVAAEAQQHANELAEATLPVEFTAALEVEIYHAYPGNPAQGQAYDSWLVVGLPSGVASLWLHRLETGHAFFGMRDTTVIGDLFGGKEVDSVESDILPRLLHPGESVTFHNPWSFFSPVRETGGYATLRVFFSATKHSEVKEVEVKVNIPPPAAATWDELASDLDGSE